MAKEDEYFRVAVSSMVDRSDHGERIWNENVIPSTFGSRRIGYLLDEILSEAFPIIKKTENGFDRSLVIPFRCEEINRVLIRITKGFLFLTHPEIKSSSLEYRVSMIQQFRFVETIPFLMKNLRYFELGDGVFRMWRCLSEDNLDEGIWFYLFYNSAGFVVQHSASSNPL